MINEKNWKLWLLLHFLIRSGRIFLLFLNFFGIVSIVTTTLDSFKAKFICLKST